MTLSQMKEILAADNIRLTKSLGQSFLHDANQLRRIVQLAELTKEERVLEIGPGLGPLTELLLDNSKEVLAIEKDRRFIQVLKARFASATNLSLVLDDALHYLRREKRSWSEWKMVANLPYSVASTLLVELAQAELGPKLMVATVQLEVGHRLLAHPGGKDYGIMTLLVQLRYEMAGWFKIPPSCFFPEPEVDSACVKLMRKAEPPLSGEAAALYSRIVKRSFSQRRKMMFKLLKEEWPVNALQAAFARAGISAQIRAEAVSLQQFVELAKAQDALSLSPQRGERRG